MRLRDERPFLADEPLHRFDDRWTSGMWAKTFAAVNESRAAVLTQHDSTTSGPKNRVSVGIPRSRARAPVSVGSIPSTRQPRSRKLARSVPSLEPMSTTRSPAASPSLSEASWARSAKLSRNTRVEPDV